MFNHHRTFPTDNNVKRADQGHKNKINSSYRQSTDKICWNEVSVNFEPRIYFSLIGTIT